VILKLNLSNCKAAEIKGLTDEFKNLTSLKLSNVGLTSLKGFPALSKLRKLDLSDNRISDGLDLLHGCPNLKDLNLSGNQIKDITALQPLKTLQELHNLDLFNCEVTNTEGYREKVFELLSGLLYLDGFDKNDEEAGLDEEDGDSEDDDDDDDVEDDEEDEVGLDYLQKPNLEDDSEGEEFAPDDENEADDLDEEDSEDDEPSRGVKRKHDGEEDEGK